MIVSDITYQRLHNQRLIGAPFDRPDEAVQWLGAVQSQDFAGAKWAIAQRVKKATDTDLDKLFNDGKILRTHVMRPTWHFVMPADIRWMLALTAPRVNRAMAYYNRRLELNDAVFAKSNAAFAKALRGDNQLTRAELSQALKDNGVIASGQRLGHLVMRAELDAVICSGPRRGNQFTYGLLDERVPQARTLQRDESLAELARRYFTGHGPALVQDFAWWSGLSVADAKSGVEMAKSHLLHETTDSKTYWFAASQTPVGTKTPTIHLLPNYDEFLIAYKERSYALDALLAINPPRDNVFSNHLIVRNGRLVGGWQRILRKNEVSVKISLLVALNKAEQVRLKAASERFGKFLGTSVTLV
jgi:hypothetical protein